MATLRHLVQLARSVACVAMAAAAPAWAGITVTTPDAFDDNGFPQPFNGGVFNLDPTSNITGSAVFSQVRAIERRRTRLLTGPDRELIFTEELDDTGFKTTLVAGEAVSARASVGPLSPVVGESPARARTSPFASQVRTVTSRQLYFYNSAVVVDNGNTYQPEDIYTEGGSAASAESQWYDTWTANVSTTTGLTIALDGSIDRGQVCGGDPNCLLIFPANTDASEPTSSSLYFSATFAVYDLDDLLPCDDPDECSDELIPRTVALYQARYQNNNDDDLPINFEDQRTLSFNAVDGHRYLAFGEVNAEAGNGFQLDFYNTFKLTAVDAPVGAFSSAALGGGDLVSNFAPVPEPGTMALWLVGLLALGRVMPRRLRLGFACRNRLRAIEVLGVAPANEA